MKMDGSDMHDGSQSPLQSLHKWQLFGLGVANIFGAFFSSYPSTGSFSRSAVNHESGAKTGLSGIITGVIVGCSLLFLTPVFEYIPQIAISNPHPEVLLTLSKSKFMKLIGKEWYFVRVHDAVQVCLQQVQSLNESPKTPTSFAESSFFFSLSDIFRLCLKNFLKPF